MRVDIRVELGIPHFSDETKVFEVLGVVPGCDTEHTATDIAENPYIYRGLVEVVIDPDAQTITNSGAREENVSNFTTVDLRISTSEIASVNLISDELFQASAPAITPTIDVDSSGVKINWTQESSDYHITGSAVFSYEFLPPPPSLVVS